MQPPSAPINSDKENSPQESTSDSNHPPLKSIPTSAGTPWLGVGKLSGNLFELRKDWPIPPASTSSPPMKIEPQPQELATPSAATASKAEKCDHQKQIQQNISNTQAQDTQQPQQKDLQQPQNA